MTTLVTVSDDRFGRKNHQYEITQNVIEKLFKNNKLFGINNFNTWTFKDILNSKFYSKYENMLSNPNPSINGRLYKPLVIMDALENIKDNEFILYTDCSPEIWKTFNDNYNLDSIYNIDIIKKLCENNGGILTAHVKWNHDIHVPKGEVGYHTHENFTTEICMEKMQMKEYKYSLQHASGMIFLKKNNKSVKFVNDWVYWNSNPECGGLDDQNWYYEVKNFYKIGHRHDQSVSGLLINSINNKLIETLEYYERPKDFHAMNFLNFCRKNYSYNFFESNQPPSKIKHKNMFYSSDETFKNNSIKIEKRF